MAVNLKELLSRSGNNMWINVFLGFPHDPKGRTEIYCGRGDNCYKTINAQDYFIENFDIVRRYVPDKDREENVLELYVADTPCDD